MIGALAQLPSVVISFTGYVSPHQASDGRLFELAASAEVDVRATLQRCGVGDFAPIEVSDGAQHFRFAVTEAALRMVDCVRASLPRNAEIAAATGWAR